MIMELWVMMASWSLFLNGYGIIAVVMVAVCDLYALYRIGEVNCWRIAALSIGLYGVLAGWYHAGDIPYYFPNLHIFMALTILNGALIGESLYAYRRGLSLLLSSVISLMFVLTALIIVLIPEKDYSLFGKKNLFLMDLFFFLPHLIPCLVVSLKRSEAESGKRKYMAPLTRKTY